MKSLLIIFSILFSVNAFALQKESIYGQDALDIVTALEEVGVEGLGEGSDDGGYVNIQGYTYYGMKCQTGMSDYGGYGSKLEGGCHFENVKSTRDLNIIRRNLSEAGLKKTNLLYK